MYSCSCLVTKLCMTLLRPHWLEPTRLLCSWYFPGKNIRVDCHFLFQGIFPTQGSNLHLLHWQVDSQYLTFIYASDSSCKQRAPQRHRSSPCFSVTYYGESEVAQSCPTLCNSMDCSLPGSSIHRIFQARVLEWVAVSFLQGTFPIQGSNLGLSHCTVKQTLYHLSHQGSITYYRA